MHRLMVAENTKRESDLQPVFRSHVITSILSVATGGGELYLHIS
jgi:hypothetical protein